MRGGETWHDGQGQCSRSVCCCYCCREILGDHTGQRGELNITLPTADLLGYETVVDHLRK